MVTLKYFLVAIGLLVVVVFIWEAPRASSQDLSAEIWALHRRPLQRIKSLAILGGIVMGMGYICVGIGLPAPSLLPSITDSQRTGFIAGGISCAIIGIMCIVLSTKLGNRFLARLHEKGEGEY